MGQRKRQKKPAKAPPPCDQKHFTLLRRFGRQPDYHKLAANQRETVWKGICKTSGLPYIPLETVVEEWKRFIAAQSEHSSLLLKSEFDPDYTLVGIRYGKFVMAAHTAQTETLLKQLLRYELRRHSTRDAFLSKMETLCREAVDERNAKARTDEG